MICDVVPMEASHLLLGRPWQFDRKVQHDGYNNRYSFSHEGRKVVFAPLSPQDVYEEQKKILEREVSTKGRSEVSASDGKRRENGKTS